MEITNLSSSPSTSCTLVQADNINILFDVPFDDYSTFAQFMPCTTTQSTLNSSIWTPSGSTSGVVIDETLRVNGTNVYVDAQPELGPVVLRDYQIETIDAIFISNSQQMTGLPYMCAMKGFRATIYATDPTVRFGRLLMEELAINVEHVNKNRSPLDANWRSSTTNSQWPNTPSSNAAQWQEVYGMKGIERVMKHVKLVAYSEQTTLLNRVVVTAASAGFAIGSCNWRVSSVDNTVALAMFCSTSALSAHPRPLDTGALLHDTDVCVVTSAATPPGSAGTSSKHTPNEAVKVMCDAIVGTLRDRKGNVLLPCNAKTVMYDIFEFVIDQINTQVSTDVPVYYISPRGEHLCALAGVYGEWLTPEKQNKLFSADMPFNLSTMIKNERFRVFPSIIGEFSQAYRQPCVVFASDCTLRLGASVHFMQIWRSNANNALVHIDPYVEMASAIGPYQPMAMRAYNCAIDTRLTQNELLAQIQLFPPKQKVLLPESLGAPVAPSMEAFPYLTTSTITSPISTVRRPMLVHTSLLKDVKLSAAQPFVPLVGKVDMFDNVVNVTKMTGTTDKHDVLASGQRLAGRLTCDDLVHVVNATGLEHTVTRDNSHNFSISIASMAMTLRVKEGMCTSVSLTREDHEARLVARNLLATCLAKLGVQPVHD